MKKNKREKIFCDRSTIFTRIQDLLADDFAEDVQAVVVGILSGNCWGLVYSTGARNMKEVQPLTTSVKTSGQGSADLRAAKEERGSFAIGSCCVRNFCTEKHVFPI